MRVALFVSSLRGGGAERAMLDIARGLSERGMEVDLVLVKAAGHYLKLVPPGIGIVDLDARKAVFALLRFARYLRQERPAVLISTMPTVNIVAVLTRTFFSRSTAVAARRANNFAMQMKHGNFKERSILRLERFLLRFADAVITNSRGAAEDLVNAAPHLTSLIRVVHNPIVWPDLADKASESVNHAWLKDTSMPVILAAGRLEPVKDYPTLLKAFVKVVLPTCPSRLIVLGEGSVLSDLRHLAENLAAADVIDFPGFVMNPFAYMSKASVFVLSSVYEGSPNVLVQAMACGTRVVSTDCPSGPREILHDGALGRLVPVGDWRSLGQAILDTLDRPVDSTRLIAGTSAYSAESSIQQYFDLVCELGGKLGLSSR